MADELVKLQSMLMFMMFNRYVVESLVPVTTVSFHSSEKFSLSSSAAESFKQGEASGNFQQGLFTCRPRWQGFPVVLRSGLTNPCRIGAGRGHRL